MLTDPYGETHLLIFKASRMCRSSLLGRFFAATRERLPRRIIGFDLAVCSFFAGPIRGLTPGH